MTDRDPTVTQPLPGHGENDCDSVTPPYRGSRSRSQSQRHADRDPRDTVNPKMYTPSTSWQAARQTAALNWIGRIRQQLQTEGERQARREPACVVSDAERMLREQ